MNTKAEQSKPSAKTLGGSTGDRTASPGTSSGRARWPWLVGLAGALVVLGPALAGGSMLNLDLVVTAEERVPRGLWGLGPELPRRIPLAVLTAPLGAVLGAAAVAKATVAVAMATATAGAARLASGTPAPARLGAGLLYGLGPFVLTRTGVGHLPLVVAMAVLPWALPHLLNPRRAPARTFLWLVAMSLGGIFGGLLAAGAVAVSLVADRGRGVFRTAALLALSQLSWLLPGAIVMSQEILPAGPEAFRTEAGSVGEILAVVVGAGFWDGTNQIGPAPVVMAGLGLILVGLAVIGIRDRSRMPSARLAGLAGLGLAAAVLPALPGLRGLADAAVSLPGGAPLRESHRLLPLWLVALAPTAAVGADRLARRLHRAGRARLGGAAVLLPLAAALVLAGPGAWGLGGRLDPVRFPADWQAVKTAVTARPGTVVALPWHQYLDLEIADGRRVHNPLPDYLGGDVLISSDPEVGALARERADRRENVVLLLLDDLAAGTERAVRELADVGVRWVVVLHDAGGERYAPLSEAPGLDHVVAGNSIDLYRVRSWPGPFLTDGGETLAIEARLAPLARLDASPAGTWFRPGAPGWMRGTEPATTTDTGLLRLPAGSGPVWYWPALLVVAGHGAVVAASMSCALRVRRARRPASVRHDRSGCGPLQHDRSPRQC